MKSFRFKNSMALFFVRNTGTSTWIIYWRNCLGLFKI